MAVASRGKYLHRSDPTSRFDTNQRRMGPSDAKRKQKQKHAKDSGTEEARAVGSLVPEGMLQRPCIHDPGNGPRVKDVNMFIKSYFAQPPSLEDPLCREFAQEEVLEMLKTVLGDEMALVGFL